MRIREDDLTGERIRSFLREHLEHMYEVTPPESVHAIDVNQLREPGVTFWSAWEGEELLGCGALRALDAKTGEIKSMRTVGSKRRGGIGTAILEHMVEEARRRDYERLYLETGSMEAFRPARTFYERHGFEYCGPYSDYTDDPNLVFMTMKL